MLLHTDRPREAREHAQASLDLLVDRVDFLEEIGNAQLIVAKSHSAELDAASTSDWLDKAEQTFVELGSTSHLAAVSIARGDLARVTGDCDRGRRALPACRRIPSRLPLLATKGGELMHRLWLLSKYVLPALVIASFFGHLKGGVSTSGFSSGH